MGFGTTGEKLSFTERFSRLPLSFSAPSLVLPTLSLESSPVGAEAWATFQDYLEFAKKHDLEGIKSLSHQISPACSDPARLEECNGLMDSVYTFASMLNQGDFKNVYSDERQIVMTTDYVSAGEGLDYVQVVLFFTKNTDEIKVLGMRFCYASDVNSESCIETNPSKRDLDQNGWWDQVEALFYR